MTEQSQKPVRSLGENLQEMLEIFKRSEISLPQTLIIAAIIIALGIVFS